MQVRRADREITERAQIDEIIARARVCRLGMTVGDQPYVVPLSFAYLDGRIYVHSALEGRKLEAIRANPLVCFEVDIDHLFVEGARPCDSSIRYRSVIGFGRASIVGDPEEKLRALQAIVARYSENAGEMDSNKIARVEVIRVDLDEVTGKQAGY